jgi:hypothetical protein
VKLTPFEAKRIENGDSIALGTILEYTSREHLPTELEIGIVEMDIPVEPDIWINNERPVTATNTFHAPDSDSEDDDDEPTAPATWRPFANDIPSHPPPPPSPQPPVDGDRITLPSILNLPGIQMSLIGIPDLTSASLNSDAMHHHNHHPIIDLTVGNSWVAPEPVIEIGSDHNSEYDEDNEEEEGNKQQSGFTFPYEYNADDKHSFNGVTQIPETQVFERMDDPPNIV